MLYIKKLVLFSIISCYTINSYGWNFQGHRLIGELAYANLQSSSKNELDERLDYFIKHLPSSYKKIIHKQPYELSKLAKVSILLDVWRNKTIDSLYYELNIKKENSIMLDITKDKISTWHYKNSFDGSGNIDYIINYLINNFYKITNYSEQNLALVTLIHLIADAHQPLHTSIKNDRGGNNFCLIKTRSKCKYNLHQFWDSSAMVLTKDINIIQFAKNYLSDKKTSNLNQSKNINEWITENHKLSSKIYNLDKNKLPSKNYYNMTKEICQERITLSAYRLAAVINSIIPGNLGDKV